MCPYCEPVLYSTHTLSPSQCVHPNTYLCSEHIVVLLWISALIASVWWECGVCITVLFGYITSMHSSLATFLTSLLRRVNPAKSSAVFSLFVLVISPRVCGSQQSENQICWVVTCCSSPPPPTNPQPRWRLGEMGGILEGSSCFLF